tara:strand:+ start:512 stop:724 length:213 start_codon:yes stop_codon:yes gene_type:complete
MSAEKIVYDEQNQNVLKTPLVSKIKFSGRVDINDLLARARKVKEKENKINLVFLGLTFVLVLIVGILLSF